MTADADPISTRFASVGCDHERHLSVDGQSPVHDSDPAWKKILVKTQAGHLIVMTLTLCHLEILARWILTMSAVTVYTCQVNRIPRLSRAAAVMMKVTVMWSTAILPSMTGNVLSLNISWIGFFVAANVVALA